jgi:hypothetical protein
MSLISNSVILKSGAVLVFLGLSYTPIELFFKKYRQQDVTEREVAHTTVTTGMMLWSFSIFKMADKVFS